LHSSGVAIHILQAINLAGEEGIAAAKATAGGILQPEEVAGK